MNGFSARVWASVAFVLMAASIIPAAGSSGGSGPQLCVDVGSQPVVQDKDWTLINPSFNYTDYAFQYDTSSVIKVGSEYLMYVRADNLTSGATAIYRGTSANGSTWNISGTPVLYTGPPGSWDYAVVFSPDVLWNGTGYLMYYVGDGGNSSTFRQIGVAFSADGITWTKYAGNPVITHGPDWYDARYTRGPSVLYDNGTYKMWYYGTAQINYTIPLAASIDYATSRDGVLWTKYPGNPVFYGFRYANNSTSSDWPSVVKVDGTYVMAFSAYLSDIGFATSSDGVSWLFNNQTNTLVTNSGWHNEVSNPSILIDGSRVLLWFDGYEYHNTSSPYIAGIGFSQCGLLLTSPPVTTVTTATATTSATVTTTSTSISTSIIVSTESSTVVESPSAPVYQVGTAAVTGVAAAIGVAAALLAWRTKVGKPAG